MEEDQRDSGTEAERSNLDAMGLDKRREVIGQSYGPSFGKQASLYAIVLAVIAALVVGFIVLAGQLDQPPDEFADRAPWAQPGADQTEPSPLQ